MEDEEEAFLSGFFFFEWQLKGLECCKSWEIMSNPLPKEGAESPSLNVFRSRLSEGYALAKHLLTLNTGVTG